MPNLTWSQIERSAYRPTGGWIWKFVGLWALSVIVAVIACAAMCGVFQTADGQANTLPLSASNPMQQDWKFWLPALAAVTGVIVAVVASYLGGFLGIAIAGLVITFAAVRYDLEKSDVGGGFPSPSLYARQTAVREQMTADERNAYRAGLHSLWRPLFVGRTIGIGLIVLGLGGLLFLQPPLTSLIGTDRLQITADVYDKRLEELQDALSKYKEILKMLQ